MTDDRPPVHEFSTRFDVDFIRKGIRRDVFGRTMLLLAILLVSVGAVTWVLGNPPHRFPMNAALAAGAVAGIALAPWKITRTARRTHDLWTRLSPDRTILYRLFEDVYEVEMPNGTARHRWDGMRRLWRYPDIWVLELAKGWSVLIPADAPREALEYISARCRAAGVKM